MFIGIMFVERHTSSSVCPFPGPISAAFVRDAMIFAYTSLLASRGPSWAFASAHHMAMCRFGVMSMVSRTRSQRPFFLPSCSLCAVRMFPLLRLDCFRYAMEGDCHDSAAYPSDTADEAFKPHVYQYCFPAFCDSWLFFGLTLCWGAIVIILYPLAQ